MPGGRREVGRKSSDLLGAQLCSRWDKLIDFELNEIQFFYLIENQFKSKLDVLKLVMKKMLNLMQDAEDIDRFEMKKDIADEAE